MPKTRSQAPSSRYPRRQPAPQTAANTSCEICGQTFSRQSDKTRHINGVHRAIKDFQCPRCDKRFAQKTGLVTHISMLHDKKRPWPCRFPACDSKTKTFGDRAGRGRHEREKHGTPGYACRDCGDRFRRKTSLEKHVNADHPGEWNTYTDAEKADHMTTEHFYGNFLDPALAAAGLTRADVDGPIEDAPLPVSGEVEPQPQPSGSGSPGRRSARRSTRRKINMTEADSDVDAEGEQVIVTAEDIYAQLPLPQLLESPLRIPESELPLDHAPSVHIASSQPQFSFTSSPAVDQPFFLPPPLLAPETGTCVAGAPVELPIPSSYSWPPFCPNLVGPPPYGNPLGLDWGYGTPPMQMMMPNGSVLSSDFSYHLGGISVDPRLPLQFGGFGPTPPPNTPAPAGPQTTTHTPTSTWTTTPVSVSPVPTPAQVVGASAVWVFRDDAIESERLGLDLELMRNIDPALLTASCRD